MGFFDFLFNLIIIGLVVTVAIIVLLVFAIRAIVRWVRSGSSSNKEYQALDQSTGASPEDIESVLRRYAHDRAIGSRARAALTQVKSTAEKQDRLLSIVSAKFPQESLSWSKFSSAVSVACQILFRNCTVIANRIQAFDVNDYRELERERTTASLRSATVSDSVKIERWNLMNANLKEMDDIITTNEQLLFELDKFSTELGRLGQDEASAASNDILNEIQQLSDQAKLYE